MNNNIKRKNNFTHLPDYDIELLICNLEDPESFEFILKRTQDLKNVGKIVLAIGILPFNVWSECKELFYESIERCRHLQRVVDGLIVLSKDRFWEESDLHSKEIDNRISAFICEIEQGLSDILTPGVRNIDLPVLKEMLHDCRTFVVAHGSGKGTNRLEDALRQVREVFRFCGSDMILARGVVIKIMESQKPPLSKEELKLIENTIFGFTYFSDIHLCLGRACSKDDEIEIIVLGAGRIDISYSDH